jgi:hypothetical protein
MTIERATPDPRTLSPVALVDGTDDEVIAQPGDSQRMLALAESLQAQLNDLGVRGSQHLRLTAFFVLIPLCLGMLRAITGPRMSSVELRNFTVFAVGFTALTCGQAVRTYLSIRKRSSGVRRSLREVVTLLRESEQTLAVQEHWSAMQRAEFRIRLSQFDIAP